MKRLIHLLAVGSLVVSAFMPNLVNAAVTPGSVTSLVTSSTTLKASSSQTALFSFTLSETAGETLTSVKVNISNTGGSTASGSDFASVNVYKDNGNGSFDTATDLLAGSQSTVNVGSATVVTTGSNNTITGGKFFVSFATGASWSSSSSPADSITVSLPTDAIATSENSPVISEVTTAAITADTVGPMINLAEAKNTGVTIGKNAGDTVEITFGEATNKPSITAANINNIFTLNNSHSWLDGVASIGGAVWNSEGTKLTITLSAGTSLPTVALGDTVTMATSTITDSHGNAATGNKVITGTFGEDTNGPTMSSAVAKNTGGTSSKEAGDSVQIAFNEETNKPTVNAGNIATIFSLNNSHSFLDGAGALGSTSWSSDGKVLTITLSAGTSVPTVEVGDVVTVLPGIIKDTTGNNATGNKTITGSFVSSQSQDDDEDDDNDEDSRRECNGDIKNGRLYKIGDSQTVYLAAGCRLKPFRGAAVFKARGHKFQDIKVLSSAPAGVEISDKPALPAEGTLVKGDEDKTVWFVTSKGSKRGFTREEVFRRLGFDFKNMEIISQSDLDTMPTDENIDSETEHPDGAIFKCSGATVVFKVNKGKKLPFTSADVFFAKGHQFKHILSVDCGKFTYTDGTPIN